MKRAGITWSIDSERESKLVPRILSVKDNLKASMFGLGVRNCGAYKRDLTLFFYFLYDDKEITASTEKVNSIDNCQDLAARQICEELTGIIKPDEPFMDEVFYTPGFQAEKKPYGCVATFMKVKPGFEQAYRNAHANIWPSILEGIQITKIRNYSIFMKGTELYSFFEVKDLNHAMVVLADDPENQRWQRTMAPMMDVGSGIKDGSSVYMQDILHFN